jgi:hypothetical protein
MSNRIESAGVPPVSEQTLLDSPIKISWAKSTKSRANFRNRGIGLRVSDRDPDNPQYKFMGVGLRAFNRQKTNVVFRTVEEAMEVYQVLTGGYTQGQYTWNTGTMEKTFKRVASELKQELRSRGYDVSDATAWVRGENTTSSQQSSSSSSTSSSSSSSGSRRGKTIGEYLKEKREGSTAVSRANDLTSTQQKVIDAAKKHPRYTVSELSDALNVSGAYIRKTLRQYHGRVN